MCDIFICWNDNGWTDHHHHHHPLLPVVFLFISISLPSSLLQTTAGWGLPEATHSRVTLLPSVWTMSELLRLSTIRGGTETNILTGSFHTRQIGFQPICWTNIHPSQFWFRFCNEGICQSFKTPARAQHKVEKLCQPDYYGVLIWWLACTELTGRANLAECETAIVEWTNNYLPTTWRLPSLVLALAVLIWHIYWPSSDRSTSLIRLQQIKTFPTPSLSVSPNLICKFQTLWPSWLTPILGFLVITLFCTVRMALLS